VLYEEEKHAAAEKTEHVLRQEVGGRDGIHRVHDRGDDQERHRRDEGDPRVQPGPHRVNEIPPHQGEEDLEVRNRHAPGERRGPSICLGSPSSLPDRVGLFAAGRLSHLYIGSPAWKR